MPDLNSAIDEAISTAQEQSKDPAPEPTPDTADRPTQTEEKGAEAAPSTEPSELLSAEERESWNKLKTPEEKLKALDKAYTQKTQALSEQRKALEPHQQLLDAFEADPKAVLRQLAPQFGLSIADAVAEAKQAETKQEAQAVANDAVAELKASLGPELEFLADKLAPALEKIVLKAAGQLVAKEVEPLKKHNEQIVQQAASKEVDSDLEQMTKDHPDWQKYEPKMLELSHQLEPKGMSGLEFTKLLYREVTQDIRIAEGVKKANERINESARKSDSSSSGVSANRVAKAAPRSGSVSERLQQSIDDARAGISYE